MQRHACDAMAILAVLEGESLASELYLDIPSVLCLSFQAPFAESIDWGVEHVEAPIQGFTPFENAVMLPYEI